MNQGNIERWNREIVQLMDRVHNIKQCLALRELQFSEERQKSCETIMKKEHEMVELRRNLALKEEELGVLQLRNREELDSVSDQLAAERIKLFQQDTALIQATLEVASGAAAQRRLRRQVEQLMEQLSQRNAEILELRKSREEVAGKLADASQQLRVKTSQLIQAEMEQRSTLAEQQRVWRVKVRRLEEQKEGLVQLCEKLCMLKSRRKEMKMMKKKGKELKRSQKEEEKKKKQEDRETKKREGEELKRKQKEEKEEKKKKEQEEKEAKKKEKQEDKETKKREGEELKRKQKEEKEAKKKKKQEDEETKKREAEELKRKQEEEKEEKKKKKQEDEETKKREGEELKRKQKEEKEAKKKEKQQLEEMKKKEKQEKKDLKRRKKEEKKKCESDVKVEEAACSEMGE